jgi:hypothetical protein
VRGFVKDRTARIDLVSDLRALADSLCRTLI